LQHRFVCREAGCGARAQRLHVAAQLGTALCVRGVGGATLRAQKRKR
jgi:hypothetical protein